jgi:heme exporter protein D
MQFDSFTALMLMDGHGVFVWAVYAITLVVFLLLSLAPIRRDRRFFIEQSMLARRAQASSQHTANSTPNP